MIHKKIFPLLVLLLLLSACGSTQSQSSREASSRSAGEPEAFGASHLEPAHEMAGTVDTSGAPAQETQPGSLTEDQSTVTADLMAQAVECAVATEFLDGFAYDPGDPVYFWRALGYLLGLGGNPNYPIRDGQVNIPTNEIAPYVTALFGTYTAQYPSLGEENPLVSEHGGMYTVTASGPFDHSFTMTDPEAQPDGTYRCRANISAAGKTGSYTITLEDYPTENGLFPYCITGISGA